MWLFKARTKANHGAAELQARIRPSADALIEHVEQCGLVSSISSSELFVLSAVLLQRTDTNSLSLLF